MEEKLREAACFGDLDSLQKLLAVPSQVDINGRNTINGWTALHWAAKRNHADIVRVLLEHGADANVENFRGDTADKLTCDDAIRRAIRPDADPANVSDEQQVLDNNFLPNYLRHPCLDYKVDLSDLASPGQPSPCQATDQPSDDSGTKNFIILKVRLLSAAKSDEYDEDFIEVDLPKKGSSLQSLKDLICTEFDLADGRLITKIRKLPNTRLRRDVEVARLTDYQELEVVVAVAEQK